jgi:hypothetical protein
MTALCDLAMASNDPTNVNYDNEKSDSPGPAHFGSEKANEKLDDTQLENMAAGGEISELVVVAEGEEKTTWFVWSLVACTSISGLLFGTLRTPAFRL